MRVIALIIWLILGVSCSQNKGYQKEAYTMKRASTIQVIGKKFKADFGGEYVFELHFQSSTQMTWKPLVGEGDSNTEKITMTLIRPDVYMVYWKEESGNTVTHIEDFERREVYTNITLPNNTFLNFKGTLTAIQE